ncbi:hypothetical protein PR048_030591 [Dryococelus australis]|uniref:Uncharacterized protein n=1 Tax=Dryococelus australis TaxID=614101 RepID=A0ABQ9G9D8_9NEOP|nr:hypothetical protein PR048_030591 [Dryococelus australis]
MILPAHAQHGFPYYLRDIDPLPWPTQSPDLLSIGLCLNKVARSAAKLSFHIAEGTGQKAKLKYSNRIRLERASQKQSSGTHKTPYDRVTRCRERKINIKASERLNVDVFTQNKRPCPQHTQNQFFSSCVEDDTACIIGRVAYKSHIPRYRYEGVACVPYRHLSSALSPPELTQPGPGSARHGFNRPLGVESKALFIWEQWTLAQQVTRNVPAPPETSSEFVNVNDLRRVTRRFTVGEVPPNPPPPPSFTS